MLKQQYEKGQRDALARFKLANAGGARNNQMSAPPPTQAATPMTPPTPAAAPMATDAAKSKVLG